MVTPNINSPRAFAREFPDVPEGSQLTVATPEGLDVPKNVPPGAVLTGLDASRGFQGLPAGAQLNIGDVRPEDFGLPPEAKLSDGTQAPPPTEDEKVQQAVESEQDPAVRAMILARARTSKAIREARMNRVEEGRETDVMLEAGINPVTGLKPDVPEDRFHVGNVLDTEWTKITPEQARNFYTQTLPFWARQRPEEFDRAIGFIPDRALMAFGGEDLLRTKEKHVLRRRLRDVEDSAEREEIVRFAIQKAKDDNDRKLANDLTEIAIEEKQRAAGTFNPLVLAAEAIAGDAAENKFSQTSQSLEQFRGEAKRQGPVGVFESLADMDPGEKAPFGGAALVGKKALQLMGALNKLDAGEELLDHERAMVIDALRAHDKAVRRGSSLGGMVASISSELPGFAIEFAATGGAASSGREAIKSSARRMLGDRINRALARQAALHAEKKALGAATRGAAAAQTAKRAAGAVGDLTTEAAIRTGLSPQRVFSSFVQRRMPSIELDAAKEFGIGIEQTDESFTESIVKAFGDTGIEFVSEGSGALMTGAKKAILSRFFTKYPKLAPKTKEAAEGFFDRTLKRLGYNGIIQEVLEERIGEGLRGATGVEEYKAPTLKQIAAEIIAFSIPGASRATLRGLSELPVGEMVARVDQLVRQTEEGEQAIAEAVAEEDGQNVDTVREVMDVQSGLPFSPAAILPPKEVVEEEVAESVPAHDAIEVAPEDTTIPISETTGPQARPQTGKPIRVEGETTAEGVPVLDVADRPGEAPIDVEAQGLGIKRSQPASGKPVPVSRKTKQSTSQAIPFADETTTGGQAIELEPQRQAPQVSSEQRGALANFVRSRGIEFERTEAVPGDLKPTQAEYLPSKVAKAIERRGEGQEQRAILISADGHVIDGHHQWLAALQEAPDQPMQVIRLDAPAAEALAVVQQFPSSETDQAQQADEAELFDFSRMDAIEIALDQAIDQAGQPVGALADEPFKLPPETPVEEQPFFHASTEGGQAATAQNRGQAPEQAQGEPQIQASTGQGSTRTPAKAKKARRPAPSPAQAAGTTQAAAPLLTVDRPMVFPVDTLPGTGGRRKLRQIIADAAEKLGAVVKVAKTRPGLLGFYDPASGGVQMQRAGDLPTAAHELAHWIDSAYGVFADYPRTIRDFGFDRELSQFWDYGSQPPSGMDPADAMAYRRGEGWAEFLLTWMVNPAAAKRSAPALVSLLEAKVPADVVQVMRSMGDEIRAFAGSSSLEKVRANVSELSETESFARRAAGAVKELVPAKGGAFKVTAVDRMGVRLWDDLTPLVKAMRFAESERRRLGLDDVPVHDGKTLAEIQLRLLGGINDKQQSIYDHGMIDERNNRAEGVEGGIDWLIGWADTTSRSTIEQDMADAVSFMLAERTIERGQQIVAEARQNAAEKIQGELARHNQRVAGIEQTRDAETAAETKRHQSRMGRLKDKAKIETEKQLHQELQKRIDRKAQKAAKAEDAKHRGRMLRLAGQAAAAVRAAEKRASKISGIGGGLFGDQEVSRDVVQMMKADPVRADRIREGARRYRLWADAVLRYAVAKGRISQDQYQAVKASNAYYVNMQRVQEGEFASVGKPVSAAGRAKQVVKKFKGSTKQVRNPYISLIEQTMNVVAESDRNEMMNQFVDMLRTQGTREQPRLAQVGQRVAAGTDGAVKVYRNGKLESWVFQKDVHAALMGLGQLPSIGRWWKILTLPATVLRTAIVKSPPFALRNRIRDTFHRLVISKNSPGSALEWAKYLRENVPGLANVSEQEIQETMLAGGAFAGHYMSGEKAWQRELTKRTKQLSGDGSTIVKGLGALGRSYNRLINRSELVGRVNEFRAAKRELMRSGLDEYTASLVAAARARELIDFATAGTVIRRVNEIIPFLNAGVQGIRATKRALWENPKAFTLRWSLFLVAPSLAVYALAIAGGDEDEYVNLPAWRRDLFWNIKVGDDTWLSIPKPFEIGVAATGVERLVDASRQTAKGKPADKAIADSFHGFGGSVAHSLLPVDGSVMLGPFKAENELRLNKNSFTGRPIVPENELSIPVDQRRAKEIASVLGGIGQDLTGFDARNVDHMIRGHFGTLGSLAQRGSDLFSDKPRKYRTFFDAMFGMSRGAAGRQQVVTQRFEEKEKSEGRYGSKSTSKLSELSRQYYAASTAADRQAISDAIRRYAQDDPLMLFNRAFARLNKISGELNRLPPDARGAYASAHAKELGAAKMLRRVNGKINQAIARGATEDQVRDVAGAVVDAMRKAGYQVNE